MNMTDRPAYKGMQITQIRIPGLPIVITPSAGIAAIETTLSPVTNVENWSTRFESCFEEFRVISLTVEIRPLGNNNGVTSFWFDESEALTPTLAMAEAKTSTIIPNNNSNARSVTRMTWIARDFGDLTYRNTTQNPTGVPVNFYVYTDVTNYGTPASTVTPLFLIRTIYNVEFRGIAPVGGL